MKPVCRIVSNLWSKKIPRQTSTVDTWIVVFAGAAQNPMQVILITVSQIPSAARHFPVYTQVSMRSLADFPLQIPRKVFYERPSILHYSSPFFFPGLFLFRW